MMSRHPEVKWAERADNVYMTVILADSKKAKVNLEPEGVFTFSATSGADNKLYELKLDLHDKVNVEESKVNIGVRSIFCILEKAEKVWWKRLLRGDVKTPHYVKVDWDKWVDEDDEDIGAGLGDIDLGGMDFSSLAKMEGMGDGDINDSEDNDDEEQDTDEAEGDAKLEEQDARTSEKEPGNETRLTHSC